MSISIRQFVNGINDKRTANALNSMLDRMLPTKLDTAITAKAGGVQATALPLNPNASFHEVTVVATAADAIVLPPARVGQLHFVKNSAALSMQVFAPTPDTVDSVATATGVVQLAGDAVLYACLVDGNYIRLGGVSATEVFGAITATSLAATAGITSSGATGAGVGYAAGAGGVVVQITNRSTGVTLSKLSGKITTDTTSLAAEASADFIVTNTAVALGDVPVVAIQSGSNGGGTIVSVSTVTAGSFTIRVHNGNVAAGTAETGAIIINFAVIKAVAA